MHFEKSSVALAILLCLPTWGDVALAASARKAPVPLAAPVGITFQPVRLAGAPATVFADAKGYTLYTSDLDKEPGVSACAGECLASWKPLAVEGHPEPPPHWSIVRRDGGRQWAYNGKPLYLSVKDKAVGETKGHSAEQGWGAAVARYQEGLEMPPGLAVKEMAKLGGQVFVGEHGMPLYIFVGGARREKPSCIDKSCTNNFMPYEAGILSHSIGDFKVIDHPNGIRQWAFKGQSLYYYDGDILAGDAKGVLQGGGWRGALLVSYFMPTNVKVSHTPYGGDALATSKGETLYMRSIATPNQGRSFRYVNLPNPSVGRALGPAACEAECLKQWRPFLAPAGAQAAGFWDVIARPEGGRQWAYRGFPLYTYTGDKKAGDINGHDMIEYARADGNHTLPVELARAEGDLPVAAIPRGTRSFIWHLAAP